MWMEGKRDFVLLIVNLIFLVMLTNFESDSRYEATLPSL